MQLTDDEAYQHFVQIVVEIIRQHLRLETDSKCEHDPQTASVDQVSDKCHNGATIQQED